MERILYMRLILALSLLLAGIAAFGMRDVAAAEAPDVIVLKDGRKVEGKITREDDNAVFLKTDNGEERGIARLRIAEIHKGGAGLAAEKVPAGGPQKGGPAAQQPGPKEPGNELQLETEALYEQLVDLGHPSKDKRKAAIERAKSLGFRAMPILLAIFHPKQKTAPELRIGAVRALIELAPLDQQGADTLGYVAMKDPDAEVRREACRAIKVMKEDRALNYILQFAIREDKQIQFPAARALREINDDRVFSTLAQVIPPVQAEHANPDNLSGPVREVELPVGPLGSKMPVFLPSGPVSGTVTNISSPPADALKIISGKDLGNFQSVWINWLQEKIGAITQKDREEAFKKRSMRDRIGSPTSTTVP